MRLTEVRLAELVGLGLGFARRVVYGCVDGWMGDRTESRFEAWEQFRR
jgi:hypothetical protein